MTELDDAYAIVRMVAPGKRPELTCILVAAAVAGMRGINIGNVRVGALFWPEKFEADGDFQLAICGGWGIFSYSPRDGQIVLHDATIDDDGGFRGHAWIEHPDDGTIIDLMHGVDGGRPVILRKFETIALWKRRRNLEQLVKRHWSADIRAAHKAGKIIAKRRQHDVMIQQPTTEIENGHETSR